MTQVRGLNVKSQAKAGAPKFNHNNSQLKIRI
jgi:hypothetical protein